MEYRKNLCSVTVLPRAIYNSPFATSVFLLTVFELELSILIHPVGVLWKLCPMLSGSGVILQETYDIGTNFLQVWKTHKIC